MKQSSVVVILTRVCAVLEDTYLLTMTCTCFLFHMLKFTIRDMDL